MKLYNIVNDISNSFWTILRNQYYKLKFVQCSVQCVQWLYNALYSESIEQEIARVSIYCTICTGCSKFSPKLIAIYQTILYNFDSFFFIFIFEHHWLVFKLFYNTFLSNIHNCWILLKIYVDIVTRLDQAALQLRCPNLHYPWPGGRLNSSNSTTSDGTQTLSKFLTRSLFNQPGALPGAARGGQQGCPGSTGRLQHRPPSLPGTRSWTAQWLATWTGLVWHQKGLRSEAGCCTAGCGTAGTPGAAAAAAPGRGLYPK